MFAQDILYPIIIPLWLIIAYRCYVKETNVVTKTHPEATIIFVSLEFIFLMTLFKFLLSRVDSFFDIFDRIRVIFPFFRGVWPVTTPLTEAPGVSNQEKLFLLKEADVYFNSSNQGVGMGIYKTNFSHVIWIIIGWASLRRDSSCHNIASRICFFEKFPKHLGFLIVHLMH